MLRHTLGQTIDAINVNRVKGSSRIHNVARVSHRRAKGRGVVARQKVDLPEYLRIRQPGLRQGFQTLCGIAIAMIKVRFSNAVSRVLIPG